MQYKVPQNLDIEDKILPFMTLRQLIVCGVGGGFTYMVYIALEGQASVIWIPPVGVLALLTLCVAFVKINDIPFVKYILLVLERYLTEGKRVWMKNADNFFTSASKQKVPTLKEKEAEDKKAKSKQKKQLTPEEIKKLSFILDSQK